VYERLDEITLAEQETAERYDHTVNVCMAAGCMSSQSGAIKEAIDKEVEANGLERWCRVRGVGCMGLCAHGPLVSVDAGKPAETMYQYVAPKTPRPSSARSTPSRSNGCAAPLTCRSSSGSTRSCWRTAA